MKVRICNYFTAKKDTDWGERILTDYELIYVVNGKCELIIENVIDEVNGGELIVIPPNINHIFRAVNTPCISCIHFETENVEYYNFRHVYFSSIQADKVNQLFKSCANEFGNSHPYRERLLEISVETILIMALRARRQKSENPLLKDILTFIKNQLNQPLNRRIIAKKFNLTPQYVNFLFKKELKITPTYYIRQQKIYLAYHLIANERQTVKASAAAVGFDDIFYFSKVFKKITGRTPGSL